MESGARVADAAACGGDAAIARQAAISFIRNPNNLGSVLRMYDAKREVRAMMTWTWQQLLGVGMVAFGLACLWSGGRMGRLLPKPWSGPPQEWLPESRRILKRSLVVLGVGAALTVAGIATFVWSG